MAFITYRLNMKTKKKPMKKIIYAINKPSYARS